MLWDDKTNLESVTNEETINFQVSAMFMEDWILGNVNPDYRTRGRGKGESNIKLTK